MYKLLNKSLLLTFLLSVMVIYSVDATQLQANAGNDKTICPGSNTIIGGSPSGQFGLGTLHYSWSPTSGLSSASSPNPTASPSSETSYTLTVTDDTGAVATDVMIVMMSYIYYQNAGGDRTICIYESTTLGGGGNSSAPGVTFNWKPLSGLSSLADSSAPRPTVMPLQSTSYTLTITSSCSTKVNTVNVNVIDLHVHASADITINEGETTTLTATGAVNYFWQPANTLTYPTTSSPDAEPIDTTMYLVTGYDINYQCSNIDTVIVTVIPGHNVYFFNTITPNGDGNNDTWYIGNIQKYPDNTLDIYNRNSKLVFHADGYLNTWDGKSFGQDLPAATYFYVLDLGDGSDKYHGTITIIK